MRKVVVEEWLGEEGIDGRSQGIATDRPLIVEQDTDHPVPRRNQEDSRWTEQELAGPEDWIVGRRNGEDRTSAPDKFARVGGGEEQGLRDVANGTHTTKAA